MNTRRCLSPRAGKETPLGVCPVDGDRCVLFADRLPSHPDPEVRASVPLAFAQSFACHHCERQVMQYAGALRGVRLGRRERWILANCDDLDTGERKVVYPGDEANTRAQRQAARRAAHRLVELGLALASRKQETVTNPNPGWNDRWRVTVSRRSAMLTPLGAAIAAAFAVELAEGKPIRWNGRLDSAAAAVCYALPELTELAIRDTRKLSEMKRFYAVPLGHFGVKGQPAAERLKREAEAHEAIIAALVHVSDMQCRPMV